MMKTSVEAYELPPGWASALFWTKYHSLSETDLERVDGLRVVSSGRQGKWRHGKFRPRPESGRASDQLLSRKEHDVYWRGSADLFVIVAETRQVLSRLISYELAGAFQPRLRKYRIDVHGLVERFMRRPTGDWFLSSAHGRTAGEGKALKVVSFYGEDVSESHLLRSTFEMFTFFSCNVKKLGARGDVAAISGDGSIAVLSPVPAGFTNFAQLVWRLHEDGFLQRV